MVDYLPFSPLLYVFLMAFNLPVKRLIMYDTLKKKYNVQSLIQDPRLLEEHMYMEKNSTRQVWWEARYKTKSLWEQRGPFWGWLVIDWSIDQNSNLFSEQPPCRFSSLAVSLAGKGFSGVRWLLPLADLQLWGCYSLSLHCSLFPSFFVFTEMYNLKVYLKNSKLKWWLKISLNLFVYKWRSKLP